MKTVPMQLSEHTVHIRKQVTGSRPSVLLVHGLGVSGDYYLPYAKELSPQFDVYIIDLPGYGNTPKPSKPLTITELANVVSEYARKSGLKHAAIVGQSMGCQIIAHSAAQNPDLFKKVILLAPTVNKEERGVFMQAFRLWQDTFHEPISANIIVFTNYLRMGVRRFIITSKYMVDDHIEDTLPRVTRPILIVTGSKDPIAPKEWGDYLSDIAPDGRAVQIEGAPHLLQYQSPEKLTDITIKFLES